MATSNNFNKFGLFSRTACACRHTSMLRTRTERKAGLPSATKAELKTQLTGETTDDQMFIPLFCRRRGQLLTPEVVWAWERSMAAWQYQACKGLLLWELQMLPRWQKWCAAAQWVQRVMSTHALLLSALKRRAHQALRQHFAFKGIAAATQLLQHIFFLQHYQSLSLGHSPSLPGSRKSTCSYHPENHYFSKAVNQQSKNLSSWGYLSWSQLQAPPSSQPHPQAGPSWHLAPFQHTTASQDTPTPQAAAGALCPLLQAPQHRGHACSITPTCGRIQKTRSHTLPRTTSGFTRHALFLNMT